MMIEIQVGKKTYQLHGSDQCVELRRLRQRKKKGSNGSEPVWEAFKWYSTLGSAFDHLLEMKVRASEATTLAELHLTIKRSKEELMGLYELTADWEVKR